MNTRHGYWRFCALATALVLSSACGSDSKPGTSDTEGSDTALEQDTAPTDIPVEQDTTVSEDTPAPPSDVPAPPEDVPAPPEDIPDPIDDVVADTNWDPDWTDNPDPMTEGCLEFFPTICNEVNECKETYPLVLTIPAGLCAPIFDTLEQTGGLLTMSCEELGNLIAPQLPDAGPIAGEALGGMIANLLNGCIENFNCDLAFVIELGVKFGELAAALGVGATGGQGGQMDFMAALPAIIELAQLCGGVENILPF
jgi:hypothetical protein